MHFSYVWKCSLVFIITVICLTSSSDIRSSTPWMVNIQIYNLVGDSIGYVYHCAGVLLQTWTAAILMSEKCFSTFPANAQMVFFAGVEFKHLIDLQNYKNMQTFLPVNHMTRENYQPVAYFKPPLVKTNYVDFITACHGEQCEFEAIGYQVGWGKNPEFVLKIVQYNFSDSSRMCLELSESIDKYCTYHDCALNLNESNSGGEVLTKIHEGITYLMGFWDYDACDKNIRVFTRLKKLSYF